MSLNEKEYNKLEHVIFDAATGTELRTEREVQAEEYVDAKGRKRHNQRVRVAVTPNIALAQKLLDQRIGGPQDFC